MPDEIILPDVVAGDLILKDFGPAARRAYLALGLFNGITADYRQTERDVGPVLVGERVPEHRRASWYKGFCDHQATDQERGPPVQDLTEGGDVLDEDQGSFHVNLGSRGSCGLFPVRSRELVFQGFGLGPGSGEGPGNSRTPPPLQTRCPSEP